MSKRTISPDEFRSLASDPARALAASEEHVEHEAQVSVEDLTARSFTKSLEVGERDLVFRMSDGTIDRHNDTISPDGWRLEAFLRSGSLLWAHDASKLPLAKPVELWVERGALYGQFRFPSPGKHAMADTVFDLFKEGTLRGVSVGFRPVRWEFVTQRLENGQAGVDYKEQELLELSATPVPANTNAIVVRAMARLATAAVSDDLAAVQEQTKKITDMLDRIEAALAPVEERAGRVLSRANKSKLRQAHVLLDDVIKTQRGCEDPACDDPDCQNPEHAKAVAPISEEPRALAPSETLTAPIADPLVRVFATLLQKK